MMPMPRASNSARPNGRFWTISNAAFLPKQRRGSMATQEVAMTDHDILLAALRHDFPSFIAATVRECDPGADYMPNWHIEAIAHHLELRSEEHTSELQSLMR